MEMWQAKDKKKNTPKRVHASPAFALLAGALLRTFHPVALHFSMEILKILCVLPPCVSPFLLSISNRPKRVPALLVIFVQRPRAQAATVLIAALARLALTLARSVRVAGPP